MPTQQQKKASSLGEQAIALAEQLGRIAGTIEGTAEAWVNDPSLEKQLMRVRDGAAQMLKSLSNGVSQGRKDSQQSKKTGRMPVARMRHTDPAHAPGKRRRKPAPSARGVKKSNEAIPKLRTARAVRQRRKNYT
jgi:hypothetical protein